MNEFFQPNAASAVAVSDANPDAPAIWDGLSLTKFRAPRLRRDVVVRTSLVQRALAMALDRPVTLVCAPAGFGKSTVLQQLAEAAVGRARVQWLALDGDDNDINRFFVSILSALRQVELDWDVAPQLLASQVQMPGLQTRAALAALCNALASFTGERLILILDDLHRVDDPAALELLADLIERLPPGVGIVLGSRTQPDLPLARWRVRGELSELLHADLQFDSVDALALARARQGVGQTPALTPEFIDHALQRTQGWAAGLSLVFGVSSGQLVEHLQSAMDKTASRHLFDFFAQEVLAELPADLADFILRCSVLPELNPVLCQALTGRIDVHSVLDDLYRRNLFLTALDETVPVLRFHDLFAEFLQTRLERSHAGLAVELHALAAQAEQVPLRAVNHWLRARRWEEAVVAINRCVEPLLAEGGLALVQRWMTQIPLVGSESHPDLARLHALCAWAGWDFEQAAQWFELACHGFYQQGRMAEYRRDLTRLPHAYNAMGRLDDAENALVRVDALALDIKEQMVRAAARAWQSLANGQLDTLLASLEFLADRAEQNPALLHPAVDDMFNSFLFGLPGTQAPLGRLQRVSRSLLGQPGQSWQVEAFALTTWSIFWHGDRESVRAALMQQEALLERLSMVPALRVNCHQALAWEAAAAGDLAAALGWQASTLDALDALGVPSLLATWRRSTQFQNAHLHWLNQDLAALKALCAQLLPERAPVEWPFITAAHTLYRGHIAFLEGDLAAAESLLLQAVEQQARWPMPTFTGDARLSLAQLHLARQRPDLAWEIFRPVLHCALAEDAIGILLTAHRPTLNVLLAMIPEQELPACQALLARFSGWGSALTRTPVPAASASHPLLRELSAREREVLVHLAAGDSNKLIARALDVSPHTVKRHVANILDKLGCRSRGQAAALWRSTQTS